jgi:hypothetical protein
MQWHASEQDPRPAFPPTCPQCGARVSVLHVSDPYRPPRRRDTTALTFSHATAGVRWHWRAWCWWGHVVEALPEQRRLWD